MEKVLGFITSPIVSSVLMILLGLAIAIKPYAIINTIGIVIGIAVIVFGAFHILKFCFAKEKGGIEKTSLIMGIILAVIGLVIACCSKSIVNFVFIIFGIYQLVNGVIGVRDAINLKNNGSSNWKIVLVPGIISLTLAVIVLFFAHTVFAFIGISIIISAVGRIINNHFAPNNHNDYIDI